MKIQVTLQGETPLLMNKYYSQEDLSGDKHQQAEFKAYRDDNGDLCIPVNNLLASFRNASQIISADLYTLFNSAVTIDGITASLGTKDFSIDERRTMNPTTHKPFSCYRPCLNQWSTVFIMELDSLLIPEKDMQEIITLAGRKMGLLDFRPSRGGAYGKFRLSGWKINN